MLRFLVMNDHHMQQYSLEHVKKKEKGATKTGWKMQQRWEKMRRRRGAMEDRIYSGKVELGCNDGWLGRLLRLLEGVKRHGQGRARGRMKGLRGGWRRERSWFSGEVTYLEANLIHSPKEEKPESGRTFRPFGLDNRVTLRAQDSGIHRTSQYIEVKRNFGVCCPPRLWYPMHNTEWQNFTESENLIGRW